MGIEIAALSSTEPAESEAALRTLAARLLLPQGKAAEQLDEHSFELFEALLALAARRRPRDGPRDEHRDFAASLLEGIAVAASPREVVVMVLGALSTHAWPYAQCYLLGLLPAVLPRLRRRRLEMLQSCLGALADRYLAPGAWPAVRYDEAEDAEDEEAQDGEGGSSTEEPQKSSERLLSLLLDCATPLCRPPDESSAVAAEAERRLVLRFILFALETAAALGRREDEARAAQLLCALAPPLSWLCDQASPSSAEPSVPSSGAAGTEEGGGPALLDAARPLGAALYAHALLVTSGASTVSAAGAADALLPDGASSAVVAHASAAREAAATDARASAAGVSALAEVLLLGNSRMRARGRELVAWVVQLAEAAADKEAPSPAQPEELAAGLLTLAAPVAPPAGVGAVAAALPAVTAAATAAMVAPLTPAESTAPLAGGRFASTAAASCAHALVSHMATSPLLAERSAAYRGLQRLLSLWPPTSRLDLLLSLLQACEHHPKATALLLHRLKEELLAERRTAAVAWAGQAAKRAVGAAVPGGGSIDIAGDGADSGSEPVNASGGDNIDGTGDDGVGSPASTPVFTPVFTPEALLPPVRAVLLSAARSGGEGPPLESVLDASMGALNLLRFLLVDEMGARKAERLAASEAAAGAVTTVTVPPRVAFGALSPASASKLRKESLGDLEARLRLEMDVVWAEVAEAERGEGGGSYLIN